MLKSNMVTLHLTREDALYLGRTLESLYSWYQETDFPTKEEKLHHLTMMHELIALLGREMEK
jgi:hypothetical protein